MVLSAVLLLMYLRSCVLDGVLHNQGLLQQHKQPIRTCTLNKCCWTGLDGNESTHKLPAVSDAMLITADMFAHTHTHKKPVMSSQNNI